jgi:hypothetical protein
VRSTGLTGVRRRSHETSKRRTRIGIAWLCVEAKQGAVAGHPSDGEDMKTSKSSLEGLVSLVIRKGHFRHSVVSI